MLVYLYQPLKETILSEIWAKISLPKSLKTKKTEDQNPKISEDFDEDVSEMGTRWTGGNENELTNFGVTQP